MGHLIGYKLLGEPKVLFGVVCILALCNYSVKGKYKLFFFISAIMLFFSMERKAWVSFLVATIGISYLLAVKFKQSKKVFKTIGFASVIGLLVGTIIINSTSFGTKLFEQVESVILVVENFSLTERNEKMVGSRSNSSRLFILYFSYHSFLKNPILGTGSDTFKNEIEKFTIARNEGKITGAHNEYQRIVVENGLIGICIYLIVLVMAFFRLKNIPFSYFIYKEELVYNYIEIFSLFIYGSVINLFLGGGALNTFFFIMPIALIISFRKEYFASKKYSLQI
jgi:O-antigen ligase